MERVAVDSVNLMEVGYDPTTQQLEVVFRAAPHLVYTYANVGPALYNGLMAADSIGSFFNYHIRSRPEMFPYTRRVE